MPGRHSESNRRRQRADRSSLPKWIALAVISLLLGGLGVFAFKKLSSRCGDIDTFAVAADPAIAPVISKVVDGAGAKELGCAKLTVNARASAATAGAIGKPVGGENPRRGGGQQGEAPTFDSWLSVLKQPGIRIGNPLEDTVAAGHPHTQ